MMLYGGLLPVDLERKKKVNIMEPSVDFSIIKSILELSTRIKHNNRQKINGRMALLAADKCILKWGK